MTRIETKIHKQNANDLVGLEVITYDMLGNKLNNVIVIDEYDFNRLNNLLDNHTHNYITLDMVEEEIYPLIVKRFNDIMINYRFPSFSLDEDGNLYMEHTIGD